MFTTSLMTKIWQFFSKIFESNFEGSKKKCDESETSCILIKIKEKRLDFLNSYRQSILSYISIKNLLQILFKLSPVYEPWERLARIQWESVLSMKKSMAVISYNILSKRYWLTIFILMKIFVFYSIIFFFFLFCGLYIVHINMHFRYAIYIYMDRSFVFDCFFYLTDTMFLYLSFWSLALYGFFLFLIKKKNYYKSQVCKQKK